MPRENRLLGISEILGGNVHVTGRSGLAKPGYEH